MYSILVFIVNDNPYDYLKNIIYYIMVPSLKKQKSKKGTAAVKRLRTVVINIIFL